MGRKNNNEKCQKIIKVKIYRKGISFESQKEAINCLTRTSGRRAGADLTHRLRIAVCTNSRQLRGYAYQCCHICICAAKRQQLTESRSKRCVISIHFQFTYYYLLLSFYSFYLNFVALYILLYVCNMSAAAARS